MSIYDTSSMDNEYLKNVIAVFTGDCKGVAITKRGNTDNHLCFNIITEDDEQWFGSQSESSSSSWIDELIEQLIRARDFLKSQDPDMHNGKQYGYTLKS